MTKNKIVPLALSLLINNGISIDSENNGKIAFISKEQNEILDLVQKAADECIKLYKPFSKVKAASQKATDIFANFGRTMPHGLGHGTGLEIHEAPFISLRAKEDSVFKEGNIVTLEPGLYYPELGGCRLENDILITKDGNKVLTNSKIFRI